MSTEREGVLVAVIDHRPYCYSAVCPVGETCILLLPEVINIERILFVRYHIGKFLLPWN